MFSDYFVGTFVFIYNAAPYVAIIAIALFILNFVRTRMIAARKRNAMKRRALKPQTNKWDMFSNQL